MDGLHGVDRKWRAIVAVCELTLDAAECKRVAHELACLGVQEVSLVGSESSLHPGWLDVIREIRRLGMRATLVSAGPGLNGAGAREAAAAGLQGVSISIDGLDAMRIAASAISHLRECGVKVLVDAQVNRENHHELEAVVDLAIDSGAHTVRLALTVASGGPPRRPELQLQPHELLGLFPRLALVAERCRAAGVQFFPGNESDVSLDLHGADTCRVTPCPTASSSHARAGRRSWSGTRSSSFLRGLGRRSFVRRPSG